MNIELTPYQKIKKASDDLIKVKFLVNLHKNSKNEENILVIEDELDTILQQYKTNATFIYDIYIGDLFKPIHTRAIGEYYYYSDDYVEITEICYGKKSYVKFIADTNNKKEVKMNMTLFKNNFEKVEW